jgi:hypothetical protein
MPFASSAMVLASIGYSRRHGVLDLLRSSLRIGLQLLSQSWYLVDRDNPNLVGVHAMIVVRENNTQANDVTPWHAGVLRPEVVTERVRGLSDDLEQTLDCQLP